MKDYDLVTVNKPALTSQSDNLPFGQDLEGIDILLDTLYCTLNGAGNGSESKEEAFHPLVNISRHSTGIEIAVELAGIEPSDIKLSLLDDEITIKGEKRLREKDREKIFYRRECSYGSFSSTITIPSELINSDACSAELTNSVLFITLPWRKETQSVTRKIPIKISR